MDFDLDRASSRKKAEREKQKRRAKLEIERKKREDEKARVAMLRVEELKKKQQLDRVRKEEEEAEKRRLYLERTGGVQYEEILKPYPLAQAATDRIVLPVSALDKCVSQDALGSHVALAFEITLIDNTGNSVSRTHAGVTEFTAEEGSVGLPPKTILSLTREKGLAWITDEFKVKVQYVRLDSHPRALARIQPRGNGFHTEGRNIVNIDLRTVLERTLQGHMTLTQGDWIPIRHEGVTYDLVVKELEPSESLLLLNTDLEVDILPSEKAEEELFEREKIERIQQQEEALQSQLSAQRSEMAQTKGSLVDQFLETSNNEDSRKVSLRVRDASGRTHNRAFPSESTKLYTVLDWVAAETPDLIPPRWRSIQANECCTCPYFDQTHAANCALEYGFQLVQSWPGHKAVFGAEDGSKTLKELGFNGRQESLFMSWLVSPTNKPEEGPMTSAVASVESRKEMNDVPSEVTVENEWTKSLQQSEENLDSDLLARGLKEATEDKTAVGGTRLEGVALTDLFHRILGHGGIEPRAAALAAQQWGVKIQELEGMGFTDYVNMIEYLNRYQGRLLRVVNALAEHAERHDNTGISEKGIDVEQVSFSEQNAAFDMNVDENNEASLETLTDSQQVLYSRLHNEYNSALEVDSKSLVRAVQEYPEQFQELLAMGLVGTSDSTSLNRVIKLLDQYQGRLERVVNLLVSSE